MIQKKEKKSNTQISETFGFTDIDGASRITGLGKSKIYKLTAQRELRHYKPSGKLLFKIQDLVSWIENARLG